MFKYVLKRLGLSIIVLLGVSIIIYFLVRLMPNNYLDTKFSAQIQQGTITLDELDDFKKRYGLYMPEAYISVTFDEGDYAGKVFTKDAKIKNHENAILGVLSPAEYYEGTYSCKKIKRSRLKFKRVAPGRFIAAKATPRKPLKKVLLPQRPKPFP